MTAIKMIKVKKASLSGIPREMAFHTAWPKAAIISIIKTKVGIITEPLFK